MNQLPQTALTRQSNFSIPQARDELNGDVGLTSEQIAHSLGIKTIHVNQAMDRRGYAKKLLSINCAVVPVGSSVNLLKNLDITNVISKKVGGKKIKGKGSWVFSIEAAQLFVVQSKSPKGMEYAKFLIDFHTKTSEHLPALLRENRDLKAELEMWRNQGAQKKLAAISTVDYLVRAVRHEDIFGDVWYTYERSKVPKADLDENELTQAQMEHITRMIAGLSKRLDDMQNKQAVKRLPPDRRR